MLNTISKDSDGYLAIGQFYETTSKKITSVVAELMDNFISECPEGELERAIALMSSNIHAIMADKRNKRMMQSNVTATMIREAKGFDSYEKYIQDISVQRVSPSIVPSVYAHIEGKKSFVITFSPDEEPVYDCDGNSVIFSKVLASMLAKCSNVKLEFNVPGMKPLDMLASYVAEKDPISVILGADTVDQDAVDKGTKLLKNLAAADLCVGSSDSVKISNMNQQNNLLSFLSDGEKISLPMTGKPYHYSLDKYGVLDNGKVGKAYLKAVNLDLKSDNKIREKMFLEAIGTDWSRKDIDPEFAKKCDYLFLNPTWLNPQYLKEQNIVGLHYFFFAVVPGLNLIILKRNIKKIPMWEDTRLIYSYIGMLKRVNFTYCLIRAAAVPKMDVFLTKFCRANAIPQYKGFFQFSMSLYKEVVSVEVKVSKSNAKNSNKVFEVTNMLIQAMNYVMDGDEYGELSSELDDMFKPDMVGDLSIKPSLSIDFVKAHDRENAKDGINSNEKEEKSPKEVIGNIKDYVEDNDSDSSSQDSEEVRRLAYKKKQKKDKKNKIKDNVKKKKSFVPSDKLKDPPGWSSELADDLFGFQN